jgi:hypothetical protein
MAKAILINQREWERDYKIYGTTLITLKLEEDYSEITFYDSYGHKLDGEFRFADENEDGDSYLLERMYVPSIYKQSGLGRAALEFFKDNSGSDIYAREND